MSYLQFPPEFNAWMLETGPGPEPLLEAAAAWTAMSQELATAGTATQSVMSNLGSVWLGAGSAAAQAGAAPHTASLMNASQTAALMAQQASTAAALFSSARSATVPLAVIEANRAQLLWLIGTNFFGQNTPMIAAVEAQYEAFWATNGATGDTYAVAQQALAADSPTSSDRSQAGSAADGGQTPPATTTPPTGDTTAPVTNPIAQMLQQLSGLPGMSDVEQIYTQLQQIPFIGSQLSNPASLASYGSTAMRYLMMLQQFARMGATASSSLAGQTSSAAGGTGTLMTQIGDFVNDKLQGAVGVLAGHFSTATNAISAKLGQAASMGALKVPQAWSMAADGMVRAAPVLPATTVSAPVQTMSATSGLPGGPFGHAMMGAMAGRGMGAMAAKAPKVIPRSPAGG